MSMNYARTVNCLCGDYEAVETLYLYSCLVAIALNHVYDDEDLHCAAGTESSIII